MHLMFQKPGFFSSMQKIEKKILKTKTNTWVSNGTDKSVTKFQSPVTQLLCRYLLSLYCQCKSIQFIHVTLINWGELANIFPDLVYIDIGYFYRNEWQILDKFFIILKLIHLSRCSHALNIFKIHTGVCS